MMNTVELKIYVAGDWQEFLIAELGDLDFDVFFQDPHAVKAYIAAPHWDDVKREHIENWLRSHGQVVPVEECVISSQNWNRRWEETIKPLAIGPFLVKPTWADIPDEHVDKILLEIDPKMSFGTGYHESTRLALRFLPDLVKGGEYVLDAGSGTGILAIAAIKLGAERAVAFDIDPWAQQNAVENFYLNDVDGQIAFRHGGIDRVREEGFDLLLANINRNVLLTLIPAFAQKAAPDGHVVLAGLLRQDRRRMLNAAMAHGFTATREETEGAWWSVVLRKSRG
ncbi:MAG: 50S ribosomal protein L11 methyltransferase [Rhodothermales bacterium]